MENYALEVRREEQHKGASINDVPILWVFFDPLPPPCPNSITDPLLLKYEFHGPPTPKFGHH